jgi:DNA repair protein RadD
MLTELWPHQTRALQALKETVWNGVRRIVVQSPTGSGKTKLAAAIVEGAIRKGNRMAFVVPAISLVDQTVEAFYAEEIRDVGVIQANHQMTDWSKPVQVCSIQTLRKRAAFPEAKVVVFDECHVLHEHHKTWIQDPAWADVPFIGLSATPWTVGLGKYFDTLLIAATTKELIDQKFLAPFKVFATGHPDLTGVRNVAGDYHEGELSDAMQKGTLTADIVHTWKEKWGKDKTLCFGVDCAHAQALQKRFEESGISCGYQDARTPDVERAEIKRKFHNGSYQIVANVGTLTTGVDWDVRCLILARPTRSRILYTQIIGRALRTAPDKEHALILDHSDTTQRLGFVTDIIQEHLDSGKPSDKPERVPPMPKECKQCGILKPMKSKVCPNCGFEAVVTSGISEKDGELIEVTAGGRGKRKGKREYTMEEKAKFYAGLKAYGIQHGRKEGWAAHSYKDKFGAWPDWSIKNVPPAPYPSVEIVMWVKSRNIAWAKSKRRAELQAAE